MPTSIDPPPADDEIECARCGAYFYYELTRCPNCGASVYGSDEDPEYDPANSARSYGKSRKRIGERIDRFIRRLTKRPYAVDTLFGAAINQAALFDDLLVKVGGDRERVERLIEYERKHYPQGNRLIWLKNAIQRWERDNRTGGTG
jgi:hypothetical protein